jgi:hypothetical protein
MNMSELIMNIRTVSIFLLLYNGLNAIVAGWLMASDPSGDAFGMSTAFLNVFGIVLKSSIEKTQISKRKNLLYH